MKNKINILIWGVPIFSIISIYLFYAVNIPPEKFLWHFALLPILIPAVLLINIVLLFVLAIKRSMVTIFPLFTIIFGFGFIRSTIAFSPQSVPQRAGFTLLSYNLNSFALIKDQANKNDFNRWLSDYSPDIICFQEFYKNDSIDYLSKIAALGYTYYYSSNKIEYKDSELGVIIFSKYPIIEHGEVLFNEESYNRTAYTDIKIQEDTVRIINTHLHSIEAKGIHPFHAGDSDTMKENIIELFKKVKDGLLIRSKQADKLVSFIRASPHPVIICGDFNQTPYDYVYQTFHKNLENSFEKAGNGFGFTYGGKSLFFLRIDHHFFDRKFEVSDFETLRHIKFSDHYPLVATYHISK